MSRYHKKRSKSDQQTTVFRPKTISNEQFRHQYIIKRRWLIGLLAVSLAVTLVFFAFGLAYDDWLHRPSTAFGTLFGLFLAVDFSLTIGLAYLDARKSRPKTDA